MKYTYEGTLSSCRVSRAIARVFQTSVAINTCCVSFTESCKTKTCPAFGRACVQGAPGWLARLPPHLFLYTCLLCLLSGSLLLCGALFTPLGVPGTSHRQRIPHSSCSQACHRINDELEAFRHRLLVVHRVCKHRHLHTRVGGQRRAAARVN